MFRHFPSLALKPLPCNVLTIDFLVVFLRDEMMHLLHRQHLKYGIIMVCFLGAMSVVAKAIEIENVKLRMIEAEQFIRISEYFTGKENTGKRVILRSDPDHRGGLYFVVRFSESVQSLPENIKLSVEFYLTGSVHLNHFDFDLPSPLKNTRRIFVGITDPSVDSKRFPIAWKIRVYLTGETYCERKSYLWEMPDSL